MTRPRWLVVGALGCAQILAWGASYYLIAVLAKPIGDQTGWPLGWIIGGLSGSFLVSGLVSPRVGGLIDRLGGRPVLASSAVLLAIGLALLAVAPNIPMYVFAWAVMGVGMGAGLYDPAFATLGRLYGEQARSAITMTTLYGGFASTVCWPLSALLVEQVGWRGACLAYAGIMLAVVLPLYWFGLPKEPATAPPPRAAGRAVLDMYTKLPNYVNNWKRLGFSDEEITGMSDRFIDEFVAWGDENAIAARVQQHWEAGANHVCIQALQLDGKTVDEAALEKLAKRLA